MPVCSTGEAERIIRKQVMPHFIEVSRAIFVAGREVLGRP